MRKEIIITTFLLAFLLVSIHVHCGEKWTNCMGNQSCFPRYYYEPKNLEELIHKIKEASSQNYHVKAIGNGYSISDIGCTDGVLLNLKNLNHILFINRNNHYVRVEAGITLQDFNEQLAVHDLMLPNQPAIAEISLGGAISCAVHGTGHTGIISTFIKEVELITADGIIHKFSKQSDPEAFKAITVSIGSIGIIYAITIECEPLRYLKFNSEVFDIENILKHYEEIHHSNEFFQFLWTVKTGKVITNQWNSTSHRKETTTIKPTYKALSWYMIDKSDKDLFSEIAIPIKVLPESLKIVKQLCEKYISLGVTISDINIRFVDKDESYLSPASQGPVAYLAFCISEEDKYLKFYEELENNLIKYGGRPHWGKLNFLNDEKVTALYGLDLQKFISVKERLDPHGTFSNDFTDRILKSH